jgi:hypothetical protein
MEHDLIVAEQKADNSMKLAIARDRLWHAARAGARRYGWRPDGAHLLPQIST